MQKQQYKMLFKKYLICKLFFHFIYFQVIILLNQLYWISVFKSARDLLRFGYKSLQSVISMFVVLV